MSVLLFLPLVGAKADAKPGAVFSTADKHRLDNLAFKLPLEGFDEEVLLNLGIGYAMPLSFFDSGLSNAGFSLSAGIMKMNEHFVHVGLDFSPILLIGNDDKYNLIEYALFFPLTFELGFNIYVKELVIIQPFTGAGVSFDILKTEKDDLYLAGEPVRDGDDKVRLYLDPCFSAGLRVTILKVKYNLTPFCTVYFYPGQDMDGEWEHGSLLLAGLRVSI